jgi:hypothetical protein
MTSTIASNNYAGIILTFQDVPTSGSSATAHGWIGMMQLQHLWGWLKTGGQFKR